ncbi:hypothetical protein [Novosphingobium sp.]|uniref:hypothetical protein n=1 Tax=unclassified Novosphingobium TaxID=2644732 RepID=UPI0028AC70DB|nr:hypothetical protein [Novosphingobium sp.]
MALQEAETLRQRYGRHVLQGLVNEIFQAARAKDESRLAELEKVRAVLAPDQSDYGDTA